MRQLALKLPRRGGKRRGAGRKPKGRRALVSHHARPRFEKPSAVQVTLRVAGHVWNLRSRRCFGLIEDCLAKARERFGLRVIEFTVLGNHLHLVVEADSDEALSRGMQGLNIRVARALNRLMERKGHVFADHYHSRLLRTPTELVNAIAYVLGNAAHHYGESGRDPFSSEAYEARHRQKILSHPRTWLLRSGWRRARTVPQWLAAGSWPPPWTQARGCAAHGPDPRQI
jgi:REP element-mobilizing transposase RayT